MRKFLFAIFVGTISSYAQNLCVQLCLDCSTDNSNVMCSQVNETCGNCIAILDSIHQHEDSLAQARFQDSLATIAREDSLAKEKERKDSLQKLDVRKFGEIVHNNCKNDTCIYDVTIENRLLKHIKAKKENKNEGSWLSKKDSVADRLPPISTECSSFCSNCEDSSSNAMCGKIEELCRCSEYREEALRLQEKATVDSLVAIQSFLMKMQQGQKMSEHVFDFCAKKAAETCSLSVKIAGESLVLLDIVDDDAPAPRDSAKVDSIRTDTLKKVIKTPVKESTDSVYKVKKKNYNGISIAYEEFAENNVAGNSVHESDANFGWNLGFFKRFYFYSAGAFQAGVNAMYHYGEYDSDDIASLVDDCGWWTNCESSAQLSYHTIMLEFPIQGRFGIPSPTSPVIPFLSVSLHIRKPVYAWVNYDYDVYYDPSSYEYRKHYNDSSDNNGFFGFEDWEFWLYFGIGIEVKRHFSLHLQTGPLALITYSDTVAYHDHDPFVTFRLIFELAW